jgi:membrane protein DedA with SNARE-associated domain
MSDFLLTQVINYGAPFLGAIVFLGGIGIPVPGTIMVVAAGAFIRQGYLPWQSTAVISYVCVLIGDNLSFLMGSLARDYIRNRFSNAPRWLDAERSFQKWGPLSIFFSRFLVTAIAIPINLIAGTTRYPFRRFLLIDAFGEVFWIFGYGSLGYLFGSQWQLISDFLSNFGGLVLGIIIFIISVRQVWNWQAKRHQAQMDA